MTQHIGVGTMGALGTGAPLCFLIELYIARLNIIHTDHTALAYRSVEPPFTKPSSYAPAAIKPHTHTHTHTHTMSCIHVHIIIIHVHTHAMHAIYLLIGHNKYQVTVSRPT